MSAQLAGRRLAVVSAVLAFVRPRYAATDVAHGFRHIERVIERLPRLSVGRSPPPDEEMMGVLAALHGLGPEIRTDAAFEAGVRALLDQLGWSAVRVDEALVGVTPSPGRSRHTRREGGAHSWASRRKG
jgi:hypothetical protein